MIDPNYCRIPCIVVHDNEEWVLIGKCGDTMALIPYPAPSTPLEPHIVTARNYHPKRYIMNAARFAAISTLPTWVYTLVEAWHDKYYHRP